MVYSLQDRRYSPEKIFENIKITDLPKSKGYTYVITQTGELIFGMVDNVFEFGVKHFHIANGRRIILAGELSVSSSGRILFNLESGSFTRHIIQEWIRRGVSRQEIKRRFISQLIALFETENLNAVYTQTILIPTSDPSASEKSKLCASTIFTLRNRSFCE